MYELICDQDSTCYEYNGGCDNNKKVLLSGYADNITILQCKYGDTHGTTPRSIITGRLVRNESYWTHIKYKQNRCRMCEGWRSSKYCLLSDVAILCEDCADALNGDVMMAQELPHFGNEDDDDYERIEYAKNVLISTSVDRLIFWDRRSYYVNSGICCEIDHDLLGIVEPITDIKHIGNIAFKRDYILRTLLSRLSLLREMIIQDIAQIVSKMMIDCMCVKLMIPPY